MQDHSIQHETAVSNSGLPSILPTRQCCSSAHKLRIAGGLAIAAVMVATGALAYSLGLYQNIATASNNSLPIDMLHATATHGGTDMAMATGQLDEDSEAVYFLDYKTGDLSCYLYYPRYQRFGGTFKTNVTTQLPATRNADYLMVTGRANTPAVTSNTRPSQALVYVLDTRSGVFAAYGVPVSRTLESAGQPQTGQLVFVAGGEVRPPSAGGVQRTIPGGIEAPLGAPNMAPIPGQPPVEPEKVERRRR